VSISLVIQRRTFRKERDSRGRDHIFIGFADGRRLSPGTPVSSTNITDLHNPNPHYILLALKWRVDKNVTKNHRKLKKKHFTMGGHGSAYYNNCLSNNVVSSIAVHCKVYSVHFVFRFIDDM
jgi:hypothetical protein